MTTAAESEVLTKVGPGTPMGELMRQYWIPALMSSELAPDGPPLRLKLLGEQLIAFYRTLRELGAENFLEASAEAKYRLGPAFIEFDRLIRSTDPLTGIGVSLLREGAMQARIPCVAVLARLYGDTVMSVADVMSKDAAVPTSYERGRPRPLLQGATSKAILAQLPTRRLTRLLDAHGPRRKFEPTAEELREELAAVRKRGYCVARGEVDKGLMGIAAPVVLPERGLIASLSLIVESATIDDATQLRLVLLVVSTASLLTEELKRSAASVAHRRVSSQ